MNVPNINMLILTDIGNKVFQSYIECHESKRGTLLNGLMLMYAIVDGISVEFDG
jgi:hypothetical protein